MKKGIVNLFLKNFYQISGGGGYTNSNDSKSIESSFDYEKRVALQISDDISVNYSTYGNGDEKVLFISGLGQSANAWKPQLEYFTSQENFKDMYQFCVYDNLGVSCVPKGMRYYSIPYQAETGLRLLQHLGWKDSDVNLVGLSMGGLIAQNIMLQSLQKQQQKIKSLALMNTFVSFSEIRYSLKIFPRLLYSYTFCMLYCLLHRVLPYEFRMKMMLPHIFSKEWIKKKKKKEEELLLLLEEDGLKQVFYHDIDYYGTWKQFLGILSYLEKAETIKKAYQTSGPIPVLVLNGGKDRILDPSNSEKIFNEVYGGGSCGEEIGNRMIRVEDSGHLINLQYPKTVNLELEKFWGET